MTGASLDLSDRESEALMGEILGATVVVRHPGIVGVVQGTLVDETMNLLVIRTAGRRALVRVPKSGATGTILLGDQELPLKGETLRVRPEDRTKRLSLRGRKRNR